MAAGGAKTSSGPDQMSASVDPSAKAAGGDDFGDTTQPPDLARMKRYFTESEQLTQAARKQSLTALDYYDSDQFTPTELVILQARSQPAIVINRIKPAVNTLKASWFGTLVGGRISEQSVAGVVAQAENGGEYAIPGGAAFTLTAPANPKSGARFGVVDGGLAFAATPCTINPGGRLINGASANLVLNVSGVGGRWWYRGDTGNWVQEAPWTDPSNAIEWPDAIIAYMPHMLAMVLAAEFNTELRQDVIAADGVGRSVMARTYAPRGRSELDQPLGAQWPQPPATQAQG